MAALKAKKRVLLIGGEGIVLYAPAGRGIRHEASIAWDVPDFDQQLTSVLTQNNTSKSVFIVFDGADQAYRKEENLPRLSPMDRAQFVKRKLNMAFPGYPIKASMAIKQLRGMPHVPPSYLFVALPETTQLDRVGHALLEAGVGISGFGLLPIESASLVTTLAQNFFDNQSRWSVLIGQHETGGLRQIVVKDGHLALARLTPTSEAGTDGPDWVEEVERGFKETLAYISRFGYTPDQGLDVIIVCNDIEKQFFDQKNLPVSNLKCINMSDALQAIGAKSFGIRKTNFADALHATWIGNKSSLSLPVIVPSIHSVMVPRRIARLASMAMVLTAVVFGATTLNAYKTAISLGDTLLTRQNQLIMTQREYDDETKLFDSLPVRPEVISTALSVKDMLNNNTVNPSSILTKLKKNLGHDIALKSLSFEHTPGPALKINAQNTTSARASLFTRKKDMKSRGKVKINFTFALPATVPLEQKVSRAEKLEQTLRNTFPQWDVDIVTQFGKVSRTGKFQGQAGQAQKYTSTANDVAEFSLEGAPL